MPANKEIAIVPRSTSASGRRSTDGHGNSAPIIGRNAESFARISHAAMYPTAHDMTPSTAASRTIGRASWSRDAPSAARTSISCRREEASPSSKFVTFAHATISVRTTMSSRRTENRRRPRAIAGRRDPHRRQCGRAVLFGAGMLAREPCGDELQVARGLRAAHIRREASDHVQPSLIRISEQARTATDDPLLGLERHPDVGLEAPRHSAEGRRHDAGDSHALAVEFDRRPEQPVVSTQPAPQPIANHDVVGIACG